MKKISILFGISLMFISLQAFAQGGGQAAIAGAVLDPSGAAIAGANVSITQKGTSAHRVVVTDASGAFNVPSLPPATYTVAVQASGFKSYSSDITILADQVRSIEVRMAVGQVSEQVTVEESTVHVDTVTPVLNHVVEQARVVDLPLNGRNAADLTLFSSRHEQRQQSRGTAGRYQASPRCRSHYSERGSS